MLAGHPRLVQRPPDPGLTGISAGSSYDATNHPINRDFDGLAWMWVWQGAQTNRAQASVLSRNRRSFRWWRWAGCPLHISVRASHLPPDRRRTAIRTSSENPGGFLVLGLRFERDRAIGLPLAIGFFARSGVLRCNSPPRFTNPSPPSR